VVVRELLVGSFRLVGGAVGFRCICIDDLAVLIKVDSEAAINMLAADVVIPLERVADRFAVVLNLGAIFQVGSVLFTASKSASRTPWRSLRLVTRTPVWSKW
jgi:hypothetical protein